MTQFVDWDFAVTSGRNLVPAGPAVTPAEAVAEVAAIRAAALAARDPVAQTSRLHTPDAAPPALVVDRPAWLAANVGSMRALLEPAFAAALESRGAPNALVAAVGGKVTGAEVGGLLAFMSTKVLGQYDIAPGGIPQLLLVAPNIVSVGRELGVDPADFRTWVCMHEETHRVQFTAVPWLREHLIDRTRQLVTELTPDPESAGELARRVTQRLPEVLRGEGAGLADLFTTPAQREEIASLTAVMSLLEGHADVVMDDVGPAHIPSVASIRAKFTERRKGAGVLDRLLKRLLGLEAKLRQYSEGARFVRAVQAEVGVDGFNAVWTSPQTLPLAAEIADPVGWLRRVHG